MKLVVVSERVPLARWILLHLRSKETGTREFREWMRRAGALLAAHISSELEWVEKRVTTPLEAEAVELEPRNPPLLVGVLGASLPLLEGFETLYPGAPIGLVAARRVEEGDSVDIRVYYERLPSRHEGPVVIIDPMLATGYTVGAVVDLLRERGMGPLIVAAVIASRPGITYLESLGGVTAVYTLALDPLLDSRFFIVPGLGDAGDRSLGVTPL